MSKITYGGVVLNQLDSEGLFQAFLDNNLNNQLILSNDSIGIKSERNGTRDENSIGVGLPLPNYPDLPKPEINTLYWPGGASQYSIFYGICSNTAVNQIKAFGSAPKDLIIGVGGITASKMYALTPRRLTSTEDPFWLVPIVDQRYFWKDFAVGAIDLTAGTSWTTLFSAIEGAIGTTINLDSVNSAYMVPHWVEMERQYQSVDILFDAAAASVGMRVSCDLQGNVYCSYASGNPLSTITANGWGYAAGGSNSGNSFDLPYDLKMSFPKSSNYASYCGGETYSLSASIGGVRGTRTIHSSCWADFTTGSGTPVNNAALQALTTRFAADWTAWRQYKYDISFNCIVDWAPTGFDCLIQWSLKGNTPHTRVSTYPDNFGTETQCSADPNVPMLDKHQLGRLAANISEGGNGLVNLYAVDGTNLGLQVRAYDWFQSGNESHIYPANTRVLLTFDCNLARWVFHTASGGGSDKEEIIKINGGEAGSYINPSGLCAWSGKILSMTAFETACGEIWAEGSDIWVVAIDGPLGNGSDNAVTTPQLIAGQRFHARLTGTLTISEVERPLYVIRSEMPASARFIHFSLTGTLTTATASQTMTVIRSWDGPTPSATEVWNPPGPGGTYKHTGGYGDTGTAIYNEVLDRYYAIDMDASQGLKWFKGSLIANLSPIDATASVTAVTCLNDGSTPAITTINNVHALMGTVGDGVTFCEDKSGVLSYRLVQIDHKLIQTVVNVYADDPDYPTEITQERIYVSVPLTSTIPGLENIIVFTTENVVTNVFTDDDYDPTKITMTTRTITTIPHADDSADLDIAEFAMIEVVKDSMVDSLTNTTKIQKGTQTLTVWKSTSDYATADVVVLADKTIVTQSKVDSTTNTTKFQQEKTTFKMFPTTATATSSDVVTLASQDIVDNVKLDNTGTPTKIQQTKKTVKMFPTTNTDTDSDIISLTSC